MESGTRQPPVLGMFHAQVAGWLIDRFGAPTEAQRRGWPAIAAGRDTLIAAPTGSGKTLAAFLVCIDRLLRRGLEGTLRDGTHVVYVSPLKALSNDIHRNLQVPLEEICHRLAASGHAPPPIRVAVRTGDTPPGERQAMLRRSPHILVTTPESLYLLLTSVRGRGLLEGVGTVIVDEIHALARDKRGSHLALTLARLDALGGRRPTRIGLSATQRPIDEMARFLVGSPGVDGAGRPDCELVDVGHERHLDLSVEVPPSELDAVCSQERWQEIYQRLATLIGQHRSTLVFVNTRRLAERVAHQLAETLHADVVASHHGSLSRELRQSAEQRLKSGRLKAIVATASLEMGIDVGYIDLVCQIGSPRSIATFLQRVGRSGHSLRAVPRGRLFPLTRDELIECLALVRAVGRGELDRVEMPRAPLDIAAQQIVAAVACEEWAEDELFALLRRAWPYHDLARSDFDDLVRLLSEGIAPGLPRGRHLHRDAIGTRLRARRGARLAALTSGGAIPETAQYRVITEPEGTLVGLVDEDFAIESMAGDVFLLGNNSWRIRYVRNGEVTVRDADGAPPSIPFWFGEAPGRTFELSREVSRLRGEVAQRVVAAGVPAGTADRAAQDAGGVDARPPVAPQVAAWLAEGCRCSQAAALQAVAYVAAQQAAIGLVPTAERIVFERFFDESGGMQLVIHAPLGARVNRAWGLALRKRFCRSFDFELQASADNDGIVLSLGPQHSFPLESLMRMLTPDNARPLLEQAVLAVPMFQVRWRWNVTRALAVLRQRGGHRVPPYLQRFQSDDLLAAVFPQTVGCLENHSGDIEVPDHALVRQTMHDCLHEAMDLRRWLEVLEAVQAGRVQLVARDTREPSPFSHELLNASPYAFLDGAALEERRTRAVRTRRSLSASELTNLGRLDPEAIAQVRAESWPVVRDADELHEALMELVALVPSEGQPWRAWFDALVQAGRATRVARTDGSWLWVAAEHWPLVASVYTGACAQPPVSLPAALQVSWESAQAVVQLVRGRVSHSGPVTAAALAGVLGLRTEQVDAALEALEGQGGVLRGSFTPAVGADAQPPDAARATRTPHTVEWCDRRLLARIHRLTLEGLRRRIRPVSPQLLLRYLVRRHGLLGGELWGGAAAVREAVGLLEGFQAPAGSWEPHLLAARLAAYDPAWMDQLFHAGELVWGRLRPPLRDPEQRLRIAALTRSVPVSLMLREDLPWLLPADRQADETALRSNAQLVWQTLRQRGALFWQELRTLTQLLPGHLDEALRELAALGLVTSDHFGPVRAIVGHGRTSRRTRRAGGEERAGRGTATASPGRWCLFPGPVDQLPRAEVRERWCRLLLRRYGVVCRDLLVRETAAPPWPELVKVLRTLELRGEVRGGRFVAQLAGEQFASEEAVEELRRLHEEDPPEPWVVISAADPLNLVGLLTPESTRVPGVHAHTLILHRGQCLATRRAGRVEFLVSPPAEERAAMVRALATGRRLTEEARPAQLPVHPA